MKTPALDEMQQMFRVHTEAALKVIVDIMTNGTGAKGEAVRLAAAKEVLNRGWGRPTTYKDKDKNPDTAEERPVWRNRDGKTYAELYVEKAAEVAAQQAAAAAAEPASPKPEASPAAKPATPTRNPDSTGYLARRAPGSASPQPQSHRGNGVDPGRR